MLESNAIYEISEDNNHAWREVNVTVSNIAPVAYIDSISPSPAVEGEVVTFSGHGTDVDGFVVAYNWRSSVDGFLSDQSSFTTSDISIGNHTLTVTAVDNAGNNASASQNFTVILLAA
jgi:hypothetical protein